MLRGSDIIWCCIYPTNEPLLRPQYVDLFRSTVLRIPEATAFLRVRLTASQLCALGRLYHGVKATLKSPRPHGIVAGRTTGNTDLVGKAIEKDKEVAGSRDLHELK